MAVNGEGLEYDQETETLTLRITEEESLDWQAHAERSGETVEETIHRVMRRAVQEQLDYDQSRKQFPS
jgi:hypothetical protein